jgi:hypothetical protein
MLNILTRDVAPRDIREGLMKPSAVAPDCEHRAPIAEVRSPSSLDLPAHSASVLSTALQIVMPWRPRQRSDVMRWSDAVAAGRETGARLRTLT